MTNDYRAEGAVTPVAPARTTGRATQQARGGRRRPTTPHDTGPERPAGPGRGRDDGMVTAETAVVLPALLLVLALTVSAVGHVLDVVRATDAARAGARAAARGEPDSSVRLEAGRELPTADAARVVVVREDDRVRVTVSMAGGPLLPFTSSVHWPGISVTAVAAAEAVTP